MKWFLRFQSDTLEEAKPYRTKAAAVWAYEHTAHDLLRFGQSIEASLHRADSPLDLAEYPDYVLSIGPRGGTVVERC